MSGSSSEKEFIVESEELLQEAENLLLNIQDSPSEADPDSINAIFRVMHTLKGMSGIYGHQALTEMSHGLEYLLDDIRMGSLELSGETMEFLFANLDILKNILGGMRAGKKTARKSVEGHVREIEEFRKTQRPQAAQADSLSAIDKDLLKVLSEYEEHRLRTNVKQGRNIYLLYAAYSLMDFDSRLKDLTARLKEKAEVISTMPTSEDVEPGSIGFKIMVGSASGPGELPGAEGLRIEPLIEGRGPRRAPAPHAAQDSGEPPAAPAPAPSLNLKSTSNTVRVDIGKLDAILHTIEEISLAKNSYRRIWEEMVEVHGHTPHLIDIHRVTQNLERHLGQLQHQVLEVRMVPIGQMFTRLAQIVRRYAREAGKKINLAMYGEDTEIDKYLAEEVIEPLVHIVRNAIDHGLEPPAERIEAGKSEMGTVTLSAYQRGNNVVIEVRDDGRGLDMERIKAKAEALGILQKGGNPTRQELLEAMFAPGFSTKETVSETSGRGVGLDVVKRQLQNLGGSIQIESAGGAGTSFNLELPITLAIIRALMVRVGAETFAFAVAALSETQAVEHGEFQTIEGRDVFNLRGELLPIVRVSSILGISDDGGGRSFAVIVGAGERRLGLLVDELLEQQDIVIKPLGDYLTGLKHYAGAAEIGKHDVIMVLDAESIISETLEVQGVITI